MLEEMERFAHHGEGYWEGPPMPGGDVKLSFNDKSWDDPEPNDSSYEAVVERERERGHRGPSESGKRKLRCQYTEGAVVADPWQGSSHLGRSQFCGHKIGYGVEGRRD